MAIVYLYLFIVICIGIVLWSLIRLERAYQYPFIMGAIFISFIFPQAFSLYDNPGSVSPTALSRVFLMSCLCAAMCWVGYQLPPNKQWLKRLNVVVEDKKLLRMGIVLLAISSFFQILLWNTEIQIAANGNWTGVATIYLFFTRLSYIALAIFLMELIKRPSVQHFAFTSLAAVTPILAILNGRRQPIMTFLIIIGLAFWFVKRYIPPRIVFASLIILGLYFIPLFGHLRGDTWQLVAKGDVQELSSTSQESLETLMEGDVLELRNAALIMDASTRIGQYGYGTGYWDALVFQFVPGQIIGRELKNSLQFRWGARRGALSYFYRYSIPNGTTPTGMGDAFREFDYFGCLFFALVGMLFRILWISANHFKSVPSMLLYIGLISPAMLTITHGTGYFVIEAAFQLIFVSITVWFSRSNNGYFLNR